MTRCTPAICGVTMRADRHRPPPRRDLAAMAKALGHPLRLKIFAILRKTKGCICGALVARLPIAQATVSQHLKVLKEAGLIRGTISGPAVCYCLDPATLKRLKQLVRQL